MSSIYIVEEGGDFIDETYNMFETNGWAPSIYMEKCDFLCLIGGIDVSPSLYGQEKCPETFCDLELDRRHLAYVKEFQDIKVKQRQPANIIGICRGGQLMNVHNGGSMWQDVDRHCKSHSCEVSGMGSWNVTSIHHQQMIPGISGKVLGKSWESTIKVKHGSKIHAKNLMTLEDPEIIWYPETRTLCFQPHPELSDETGELFFELISKLYT